MLCLRLASARGNFAYVRVYLLLPRRHYVALSLFPNSKSKNKLDIWGMWACTFYFVG